MPSVQRNRVGGQGRDSGLAISYGLPQSWWLYSFSYADPPVFESQAAFLLRHDLLLPGEKERLDRVDYLPVTLPAEWWPKEDT